MTNYHEDKFQAWVKESKCLAPNNAWKAWKKAILTERKSLKAAS